MCAYVCACACVCVRVCVCVCMCVSARDRRRAAAEPKISPSARERPLPVPSPAPPRRRSSLQTRIPAGRWRRVLPRASASWGEGVRVGSGVVSLGLWHPPVLVPKWTHSQHQRPSPPLPIRESGWIPKEMLSGGGVLPHSLLAWEILSFWSGKF